ncbi:L-tyrosine decarboxylase [Cladobotryum mycophilum]|uniref:L-tyrosine decarboxylase n=1 Tax=Cladobotryum mycophilum TaxID=491253 RepID=A0ABR0SPQ4_9HYPO
MASVLIRYIRSGYINYPAGGLCYRDNRMRYLITWTSPIIFRDGDDEGSMGVYGVEGSKPGAAPVAAWLTHETLGLSENGYGRLPKDILIVAPLIPLPESYDYDDEGSDLHLRLRGIGEVKQFVHERIIKRDLANEQLRSDRIAFKFMSEQGSDLMVNAFACNFKIDGVPNRDVGEANYLNQRIFQRLSVTTTKDKVADRPLFLTSSTFREEAYGECLRNYKRHLHLVDENGDAVPGDLTFLVNVTMNPWPTSNEFLDKVVADFKKVAEDEMERSIIRNKTTPDKHSFVMQGFNQIYLVYLPMFYKANRRRQLILTVEFPLKVLKHYQKLRKENPEKVYIMETVNNHLLSDILVNESEVLWHIVESLPSRETQSLIAFMRSFRFNIVINKSLRSNQLMNEYPKGMPFYLYGNNDESHIDHALTKAPNAQLTAAHVKLDLEPALSNEPLRKGVVAVFEDILERIIQPLPINDNTAIQLSASGLNLTAGSKHRVSVYESYHNLGSGGACIARGYITLRQEPFADWKEINGDPAEHLGYKGPS